jgi:hypothetical protein
VACMLAEGRTNLQIARAVAGVTGATTGDSGAWDVTPQLERWSEAAVTHGIFVLSGDDESPDVKGQSMCLSYLIDLGLAVEYVDQEGGP